MLAKTNWHPQPSDVRYFSITLAILAVLLAVVALAAGKTNTAWIIAVVGVALAISCFFVPRLGRWLYLLWMAITVAVAFVISPIVIAIIFYLVLTPIALFSRLIGKDELRVRKPRSENSHFSDVDHEITAESFRRQF